MTLALLLVLLTLPPADVCELLSADDISAVQSVALKERKSSVASAKGLRFAQCFYAAGDFTRSVSVTVISNDSPAEPDAARAFWQHTFDPQRNVGRKNAARPVSELGDAAFWTSDSRAGVLYVLVDDAVIRLSVGGVSDEVERLNRTTALAAAAVKRLSR
jgi:hypothetical protein